MKGEEHREIYRLASGSLALLCLEEELELHQSFRLAPVRLDEVLNMLFSKMAGKEIPCPWQAWVAPCTAHLKAGSNIVSICLRNISLQQFRRHRHHSNVKSIVGDMFSLAALKHNQKEMKHHVSVVPPPRRF